jgi:hypothetical protein
MMEHLFNGFGMGCLFMAIITMTMGLCKVGVFGAVGKFEAQAVKYGYGKWIIDKDPQDAKFEWIKPEGYVEEE